MPPPLRTAFLLLSTAFSFWAGSQDSKAATFTAPITINEGDATYDGQDIVVDGTTVTINGPHSFNSLLLTNGAVLTHSACTTTTTYKLDLTVTNSVTVSADSRIDVSGRGYLAGRTTGNTTLGASYCGAGGSHGGLGGVGGSSSGCGNGLPNEVYGDYADPDDWGSGGTSGGAGGGLVRLRGGSLQLDGKIVANGNGAPVSSWSGGGSGGGILLRVGVPAGVGEIRADGGNGRGGGAGQSFGSGGGGGGGRIAVYADDFSSFAPTNIVAQGGLGYTQTIDGGAGTVYVRNPNEPTGLLIVDGGTTGGFGWTPIGRRSQDNVEVHDRVLVRGSRARVRAEHPELDVVFLQQVTVTDGGRLELVNGAIEGVEPLVINHGGQLISTGSLTSAVPITVSSATLTLERLQAMALLLENGSLLTCRASTTDQMFKLEVEIAGLLEVSADSRIDVSGRGYLAGRTTGNTSLGASYCGAGGSHGGLGGVGSSSGCGTGQPNAVYGDYADPDDWGSGSSSRAGGGLLRIRAGLVELHGQFLANGASSISGGQAGGSGGGILLVAEKLSGSGQIGASGGFGTAFSSGQQFGSGGGGGGGRIAVYVSDTSGFALTNIVALGGIGSNNNSRGADGSVHVVNARFPTRVKGYTPTGQNGGYLTSLESVALRFSREISTNQLFNESLSLIGPLGSIPFEQISLVTNRTYQLNFPLQSENGAYRFELLPSLLDAEGFPLDQNANGIPGEPEDGYTFTLIVDTVAPRIVQHTPAGDLAGTITSVDLFFSEAIDKATFTPADIAIRNPTNGVVAVSSVQEVGFNRFRVAFPAQTEFGPYHVLVGTNITDLAGNALTPLPSLPPDGDVAYAATFNLVPVDLELFAGTTSTNVLWAGDTISIDWQGRNVTGAPLIGDWLDGVYLSPDPDWNITDVRLGSVPHTGGLAENETYLAGTDIAIPGDLPGNYYLIVRADIGNGSKELDETNNQTVIGPLELRYRELEIGGGELTGTLTSGNRNQYAAIRVAGGESLRLTLTGGSGVNHLFVNQASIPATHDADFTGRNPSANQTVTLTGAPGGATYYILIHAAQISAARDFQLSAETAPLFVDAISPRQMVSAETDRFWVETMQLKFPTLTITGAGFDGLTTVELIDSGGAVYPPVELELASPTTLRVFLSPAGLPADVYDVRVTRGVATRTLADALTVFGVGEAQFEARILSTALSPGGGQTVWIEYQNKGQRAMPAPLLKVTAYTNAIIRPTRINWNALWAGGNFSIGSSSGSGARRPNQVGRNYRVGVPIHTLQLMAVGSSGTPGLLQPGERGRLPVYFEGLQRDQGERNVQFSVGSVTADDTTVRVKPALFIGLPDRYEFPRTGRRIPFEFPQADGWTLKPFTIPWDELRDSSRPEAVPVDGWNAVWSGLIQGTGTLWADYTLMMSDNLNHLAQFGQATNDPAALFNFEILQASAALNPVRTLAGAVDASSPSPGFPLVFRRVYGQPILSRYELGPLGRGWSHNWDVRVRILEQFNGAVIQGPGGADRFFGRDGSGTYSATDGDTGRLVITNNAFRLIEADGTAWDFGEQNDHLRHVEDPNGNRITCGYTGTLLTSLTHTSGRQLLLDYDGNGRLRTVTDPLGPGAEDDLVIAYDYDGSGQYLRFVTLPGGRVTEYTYETAASPQRLHALRTVTHPDLRTDHFDYDDLGRLQQTYGGCCGGAQRVTYSYDSAGTVHVDDAGLWPERPAAPGARRRGARRRLWL